MRRGGGRGREIVKKKRKIQLMKNHVNSEKVGLKTQNRIKYLISIRIINKN